MMNLLLYILIGISNIDTGATDQTTDNPVMKEKTML